jgi:tripartite-type tricarboxylate transporter receptor subunit TctC
MRTATVLFSAACISATSTAVAQPYPTKPIRIVVPFVPAGPTDMNARLVAQRLTAAWGQSVIVDNRPGAGGVIGTEQVARAAPDGYTLLAANPGPLTIAPSLRADLHYDPQKSFSPVVLVTHTNSVFAVHPSVPARNINELIALAKQKPGELTYGSPGVGTVGHLTFELLCSMAGIKLAHIPYKGTAQGTTDLLSGQLALRTFSIPVVLPLMKQGKVRVIGNNGLQRSPLLPDVPTLDEQGLKGFESSNWNGIMAPTGTPAAIVEQLRKEIMQRVLSPAGRQQLLSEGYNIAGLGPAEFTGLLKSETVKWAKVIKAAKIAIE